jgi:hypothetical protein
MPTPPRLSDAEPSDPPVEPVETPPAPAPAPAPASRRRRHRRVTTAPPPGSDPEPLAEPERHELTENDDRLKQEKPPHY